MRSLCKNSYFRAYNKTYVYLTELYDDREEGCDVLFKYNHIILHVAAVLNALNAVRQEAEAYVPIPEDLHGAEVRRYVSTHITYGLSSAGTIESMYVSEATDTTCQGESGTWQGRTLLQSYVVN